MISWNLKNNFLDCWFISYCICLKYYFIFQILYCKLLSHMLTWNSLFSTLSHRLSLSACFFFFLIVNVWIFKNFLPWLLMFMKVWCDPLSLHESSVSSLQSVSQNFFFSILYIRYRVGKIENIGLDSSNRDL